MYFKKIAFYTGILFIIAFSLSSCSILKQANELITFTNCDFSVGNVKIISIAGINVEGVNSIDDLALNDYLKLAKQAFSKDIPSEFKIEIKAKNGSDKRAYISGLDWQLFFKDDLYTKGAIQEPIEVQPFNSSSFNVITNINLLKIINSDSFPEFIKTVIEQSNDFDLSKLDVTLKVKPWYNTGSSIEKYPGYISIHP